jgi:DNA integrity scanning protein DisA with diadenylate cyclase activity
MENPDDILEECFQAVIPKDEVQAAAERILRGEVKAVLLLPTDNETFLAVTDPVLPLQSLASPRILQPSACWPYDTRTSGLQCVSG